MTRHIRVSQIKSEIDKDLNKITENLKNIAEQTTKRAIANTREAMRKHAKNGRDVFFGKHLYFKRSALGEIIGKEPFYYRNRYHRGSSTYDSMKQDISPIEKPAYAQRSITFGIKDTSPRSNFKHGYYKSGNIYLKNSSNILFNRDKFFRLKNGRSGPDYGLLRATNWAYKQLGNEIIRIIKGNN